MATTRLTHIQRALLDTAARRPDGSLLPMPETLDAQDAATAKAVASLIRRSLVEEAVVIAADQVWRQDDERQHGLTITAAGREAVGIEPPVVPTGVEEAPAAPAPSTPAATSKIGLVVTMLRADGGATLADLTEATGWLPHTTRAALTGLRKKGHAIAKGKRDAVTCYTLEAVA